jgi:hypothetical protein
MFKFSGRDINGNRHIGLLAESKGYKGQPEKGFYISNGAGSPWAYQVRAETVSRGIEIDGKWYFAGDICFVYGDFYGCGVKHKAIIKQIGNAFYFDYIGSYFTISDRSQYPEIEIIGNKWDNKELLGEQNDRK